MLSFFAWFQNSKSPFYNDNFSFLNSKAGFQKELEDFFTKHFIATKIQIEDRKNLYEGKLSTAECLANGKTPGNNGLKSDLAPVLGAQVWAPV